MLSLRHLLSVPLLLSLPALPALCATSSEPFSFDIAPGRLPKDVVPTDYSVSIQPDVPAMAFEGTERVILEVRRPTARLQFNTLNETLREVRLDGEPVQQVVTDDASQLTTVTLAGPVTAGRHILTLAFRGRLETMARGLFVQPYVGPGGREGLVLSTKMESTEARRMFPCWDEPAFRATFELTVTVPRQWAVISNMPAAHRHTHGALATTTFQRSPRMPSYLIEFTGGDMAAIHARSDGVRLGVWAVRGRQRDSREALRNAQLLLADYDSYFDYHYPLPKLDSIAIPGGFAGAMENWGAITYNDQLLLLDASSTFATRQAAFSVQAHEMAHQWSGDLVTMGWWDDIWLNESFASWMASRETALRNPDWHWWEGKDADKEDAMSADALAASHPIQQHVSDELQATAAFDPQITYRKGQAILRMFEAFLGPDVFRDGIRTYLRAHAYSNASTADLWDALGAASGRDMRSSFASWTEQAGFPLLTVTARCDPDGRRSIHLSQSRFLLDGSDAGPSHWSVPLQIRSGGSAPRGLLMTGSSADSEAGRCGETLSVNADAIGYYRARYDESTLAMLAGAIGSLPRGDRIALLDDQWALARAGMVPLSDYLQLAGSLHEVIDARSWEQIAGALSSIEFEERGSPGHDAFARYAIGTLAPVLDRLGWDTRAQEEPDIRQLRRSVIASLGEWGDPAVIEEARRRFHSFLRDRRAIAADDQAMILDIVGRYADEPTFAQLHAIARSTHDEAQMRRYFGALMGVTDPGLAEQAARIALSDEIPPQAGSLRLGLIVRIGADHPQLSWSVFTRNAADLLAPFARYVPLISAQQVPRWYWKGVPIEVIDAWVRGHVPGEMTANIERGLESARLRLREQARLLPAADAFVQARAAARARTPSVTG